ncbi:MAG: DUF3857 domain-containing protein, partial [Bacteroidales bacterium]|nr:DUF3857 domain-containing protein [Bacteroidales bacterium]
MKYINIFSIIIISLIISSCQSNNLEQESDAIYKSIKKIYTLNADGSANYQYQHQLKYITHFSFNRLYGESFIVYNPDQQELKINKAETKMVDGKIVPSPENAFNEILPRFAAGAPPFNHLREMVVTHAGLELGCVVDFDYELSSKAGYLPFFNENIILQENVPVENLEIIVNIPDETELNHNLINIETKAKVSKKDGYTQYTWKFKNLNGLVREANQAHDKSFLPRLTFSNINMQNALNKLYNNLDLTLTDNIKETITKRVSDKKKEIHIIRELQKIVDKEMNTLRIPLEYTAYSARPLSEVWESNAGTELEKTFLFNELLKFLDVDSKVILAVSPEIYNKEVGNLKDAGHYYIQTKIDGEDIIISTNLNQANNLALNLKGIGIIDEEANSINIPDSISDLESSFKAEGSFQMNDSGGISGEVKIIVKGMKNPYLNYLDQTKNAKEVVTSLYAANAIEDYDVINFDNKQSEINATIKDKEIWKNQGNYYFMETPTSSYGIKGEHLSTLLNERKTPLQLSNFINESYDFNISLPEGFSLVSPNIKKELSNGIGSVIIEISSSDRDVHVIKSLKINKLVINPIEYNDFKNLINLWNKK